MYLFSAGQAFVKFISPNCVIWFTTPQYYLVYQAFLPVKTYECHVIQGMRKHIIINLYIYEVNTYHPCCRY